MQLSGDPVKILAELDDYEGATVNTAAVGYEYVRRIVPVDGDGTVFDCWVYVYTGDLTDAVLIPSGDYLTYRNMPA